MSNLDFTPKPIEAVAIRRGERGGFRISNAIIQRTTALRAYNGYVEGHDWMEKLSTAYVVAIATRSADAWLMQDIQNHIPEEPPIACSRCREATIGANVIRARLFPRLGELREHANALIHHLDFPENRGIDGLNIEGIFDYCYHLFEENADAFFGTIPSAQFDFKKCKTCRTVAK
ncbi:MAG TPA: hypothetical protein PLZ79_03100 [Burkholderiales bacterium]|nr:hypothetical protein [Betaproteobacteria bacterium]HQR52230.1 hypothetical protein [Burkholderiales bacterium]